ncbi:putative peptide modification system cyclase [Lysobacter niastensis]|uniref:Peptide modification system cyclase n=1 Tax=Lysobacter niastensis TaxID=380629 RepID=A0ABS0B3J9_9GAMM|nr:putative peptide modification system cyclase [Lysobacter niastensis]MBF6023065.1 putative peptide modification system cyclase [Lysobacter niastensis]
MADGPQLRTLLLTDLCDSTSLVERIGDVAAAGLFREHDGLVLQLQQQWRGRLIDRSDGMLLLFERPIDGLGFALDYERGLQMLGRSRNLELRARAGLHVGEVLTWRNSDTAVRLGAKPLEVEGLAKPMAARLMSMARPGQILLSAVAEPLAHRAARELGERGQHLIWKSLGRWRFKGLPESQYIFEVGEPGIAPLRAPPNTPKAWRDIPLWRRPAALVAEVALIAAVGVGAWFVTRPQPAIAFNQRDWVVVADLRNLTGQSVLDDSLEQAFRISLEQSRYVNVLSDLKARDTLARMQRSPDTTLDRAIASEIALRDGARAVILPTVAEVGGRVRVSAEVIDPHTQATVYAESADGNGAQSALASIDDVTGALRGKLGEALESIEKDSAPLPQVTTVNLDALRAYALAQKAYVRGAFADALKLYTSATNLDPQFALAWLGQVRARVSSMQAPQAVDPLRRAQTLQQRLPTRERMYLDAWAAEFDDPSAALDRWIELASLYPDFWPGNGNAAAGLNWQNRLAEALPFAIRNTSPQNELAAIGYDVVGRVRLGLEQYELAATAFDQATIRGFKNSLRRQADVEAAQRRYASAARLLGTAPANDVYAYLDRTSLAIDQGRWSEAQRQAGAALRLLQGQDGFDARSFLMPAAVADWLAGDRAAALGKASSAMRASLASLDSGSGDAVGDAGLAMSAAMLGLRLDDRAISGEVQRALARHEQLMRHPKLSEQMAVLRAEELRLGGKPGEAVAILLPLITGNERYQTRVALMEAYAAGPERARALEQSKWLQQRRGLAYIEQGCGQCLQALNVADSNLAVLRQAELLHAAGDNAGAARAAASFDRLWPAEALNGHFKVRRSSLGFASN